MRLKLIDDNPLRVLGVYANSTLREIEHNKSQLRAFARIGQEVELPLWLNGLSLLPHLPMVDETMLEQAQAKLSLQEDRERYQLFWFEFDSNFAQEDQKVFELLNSNRYKEACLLLEKRTDRAAQKNLLLISVMSDNWIRIADSAPKCFESNKADFRRFMNEVIKESKFINSSKSYNLIGYFHQKEWEAEMRKIVTDYHKQILDNDIDHLQDPRISDPPSQKQLIDKTLTDVVHIEALLRINGYSSLIYKFYSNEIAKLLIIKIFNYWKIDHTPYETVIAKQQIDSLWKYLNHLDNDYNELCFIKRTLESITTPPSYHEDAPKKEKGPIMSLLSNLFKMFVFFGLFVLGAYFTSNNKTHTKNDYSFKLPKYTWPQQYSGPTTIPHIDYPDIPSYSLEDNFLKTINRIDSIYKDTNPLSKDTRALDTLHDIDTLINLSDSIIKIDNDGHNLTVDTIIETEVIEVTDSIPNNNE